MFRMSDFSNKPVTNPDCMLLLRLSKNPKSVILMFVTS
jgi:hypothetical protein